MKEENLSRLNAWYEMIKPEKELDITEARRLNNQIRKLPSNREELREELILGTLHVVRDYLKGFSFIECTSTVFDIDDMIDTFCEVWIENLEQVLYRRSDFSTMFNSQFFEKINEKLGVNEKSRMFPHITKIDFNDMFFDFFMRQNSGKEVSYDDFMKNIERNNNMMLLDAKTKNSLKVEYTSFYKLLNRSYEIYSKYGKNDIPFSRGYVSFLKNFLIEMALDDFEDSYNVGYACSTEDYVLEKEKNKDIKEIIETLTPIEQNVIKSRLGFEDDKCKDFEKIGKELGVTGERVRQIEHKAHRKLKHPSRARRVKDYYIS